MTWLILAWRWIAGSKIGQYAIAALAIVALIFGFRAKWQAEGRQKEKQKAQDETIKAHERINDADIGSGATDAERVKRLRDISDKWGRD